MARPYRGGKHLSYSYRHSLILDEKEEKEGVKCEACGINCFIHPRDTHTLKTDFFHPLALQAQLYPKPVPLSSRGKYCCSCSRSSPGFTLFCDECYYVVCVKCALEGTMISAGEGQIEHISHDHPLTLNEMNGDNGIYCKACEKQCLGPTYICNQCDYLLHESCAHLPLKLQHPFHPQHSLNLYSVEPCEPGTLCCDACKNNCTFFFYRCHDCNFDLDIDCTSLRPSINYEAHFHPLTLFEKKCRDCDCNICGASCDTFFLRCVECDYSFHIYCHPSFSQLVKHTCHIHPLNFIDSKLRDGSNLDELYCDACEKEEIICDPYYYCSECNFIAHIGCVISEVLPSLNSVNMRVANAGVLPIIKPPMIVKIDDELKVIDAEKEKLTKVLELVIKKLKAVTNIREALKDKRAKYIGSTSGERTK